MYEQIMSLALGNGLWAALFCLLFVYQLKDSRARETRYSAAIASLTDSLGTVKTIKSDCDGIALTLHGVKSDCTMIKSDCAEIKCGLKSARAGKKKSADNLADSAAGAANPSIFAAKSAVNSSNSAVNLAPNSAGKGVKAAKTVAEDCV